VSSGLSERTRRLRVWSRLLVVLRLLAVVLSLQLSGVGEPLTELVCAVACDVPCHHDDESSRDGPCNDCPPGCPSCHCANALVSIVPASPAALLDAQLLEQPTQLRFSEQAPPSPELSGLFRPPQHDSVSS
jgi:hypothetical protein